MRDLPRSHSRPWQSQDRGPGGTRGGGLLCLWTLWLADLQPHLPSPAVTPAACWTRRAARVPGLLHPCVSRGNDGAEARGAESARLEPGTDRALGGQARWNRGWRRDPWGPGHLKQLCGGPLWLLSALSQGHLLPGTACLPRARSPWGQVPSRL